MTPAAILQAVLLYGPQMIPLLAQLNAWVKENKTEVTEDDWALLHKYGTKKAEDYLK